MNPPYFHNERLRTAIFNHQLAALDAVLVTFGFKKKVTTIAYQSHTLGKYSVDVISTDTWRLTYDFVFEYEGPVDQPGELYKALLGQGLDDLYLESV